MGNPEDIKLSPQAMLNRAFQDADDCFSVCITNPLLTSNFDIESKRYCDEITNTNVIEFIRHFIYNQSDGSLDSTYDTDLAGVAYAVVGTARFCEDLDIEKRCLIDSNNDKFLRHYVYDQVTGVLLRTYDTDLDGNAFVAVGTVADCPPEYNRFQVISCERFQVVDNVISTLTVPVGAVYAEIQVKFGELAFTIDLTNPTNTGLVGYIIGDNGFIKLGEGDPDNSGSVNEIFDFRTIALSGNTCTVEACYYEIQ